jgi:hypothetical protein
MTNFVPFGSLLFYTELVTHLLAYLEWMIVSSTEIGLRRNYLSTGCP